MQVVERVVTEVRERRIEVPHSRSECIRELFANDEAIVRRAATYQAPGLTTGSAAEPAKPSRVQRMTRRDRRGQRTSSDP